MINPGFQYVIYTHSMSSELMWQYVISEENPSVEGYLTWAQNQTNPEHIFYLQAIINFHINRSSLKTAARRMSAPIWSARCHPIYQLIEVTDEAQMLCLKPGIRIL